MPGMNELAFSMHMRDIVDKMVKEAINRERPRYRYATVKVIDRTNMKCDVIYNGETSAVRVNMGSIQPSATEQIVRVEGIGTDKFITDVIGESYKGIRRGTVEPYYSSGKAKVTWDGDSSASGPYEVIAGASLTGGDKVTSLQVPGVGTFVLPVDTTDGRDFRPKWHTPTLANGWGPYSPLWFWNPAQAYNPPQFTKTSAGIVKLKGLIAKSGTTSAGELIFTLPEGFRPAAKGMFAAQSAITTTEAGSIDIDVDGRVIVRNLNVGWSSLENIAFPSADVAPNSAWTVPTLLNSFQHYTDVFPGGGWAKMSYWEDSEGVVWRRGLGYRSTVSTSGLDVFVAADKPAAKWHHHRIAGYANVHYCLVNNGGATHYPPNYATNYFSLDGAPYINRLSSLYLNSGRIKALGFQNGWTDYDIVNYSKGEMIRMPSGMVYLKGLIKSGTGSPINIPAPYRPWGVTLMGTIANGNTARFDLQGAENGNALAVNGFSAAWSSLDGLCWIAETEPSF